MAIKLGKEGTLLLEDPIYLVRWPFDHVVTSKIPKTYLHFCNSYGHETWRSGNLRLKDPTH